MLCVDRAIPIWGKPEDGHASDKTLNTTLLSEIAQILARQGVAPGAYIYIADAALVTEDNLHALEKTLFISRLPATYTACERAIAAAVAQQQWEEVGIVAQTKPTQHRPAASYKVSEQTVILYGTRYRAVVIHSSSQDQRRQQRFAREKAAAKTTRAAAVGEAAKQVYFCRADAEAAAEKGRALQSSSHQVEVVIKEHPTYGPGRPSAHQPRPVKAWRYGLQVTLHERAEVLARKAQEAGCFVLLTNVPTAGEMAHSAGEVLRAYQAPQGVEQNFAFLQDPVIVNSLFLKKPERIEALGLVLLLALLLWRLVERALRGHVETTGNSLTGWDNKETQKPTAFMMMTKFAAVMVITIGAHRRLAQPLSAIQQAYLHALGVPATAFLMSSQGEGQLADMGQCKTHRDGSMWHEGWRGMVWGARAAYVYGTRTRTGCSSAGQGASQVRPKQEQRGMRTARGMDMSTAHTG
jgi:transposase